jgi:hypothetical protein
VEPGCGQNKDFILLKRLLFILLFLPVISQAQISRFTGSTFITILRDSLTTWRLDTAGVRPWIQGRIDSTIAVSANSVGHAFYWGNTSVTAPSDTTNMVGSISALTGFHHWPLNHRAHRIVKLTYTTLNAGESVSAIIPFLDVPTNSSVILRFFPGVNPVFRIYAVPLSTGRTNTRFSFYGQLLGTFATNISWSGSSTIIGTLWLNPQ